jgi:hypothetical protein
MGLRGPTTRNLVGAVSVLVAVLLIPLVPLVLNANLPGQRPLPVDQPLALGGLPVTVTPPRGAVLDATRTKPDADTVQLVVGGVEYQLAAAEFDGSLAEQARQTREAVQRRPGIQIVEDERNVTTRQGVTGRQAAFADTRGPGRYAVFVHEGIAVTVLIAKDATPSVPPLGEELEASIASLTIGQLR